MIADLPDTDQRRLANAPLDLVIWQLAFAEAPHNIVAPDVGPRFAEFMAADGNGEYAIGRQTGLTFNIQLPGGPGPAAPQIPTTSATGWQFRREQLAVTLSGQALGIETTNFGGWDTFRPVLARALEAAQHVLELPAEQRLGLRYVDKLGLDAVHRVAEWTAWVQPWLQGPLAHPQLGEAVAAYAQQVDFEAGEGIRASVRQRAFSDPERRGRATMLLDFDVFREGYRLVDTGEVLDVTDRLNDISHRLFQSAITTELYAEFAREPNGD